MDAVSAMFQLQFERAYSVDEERSLNCFLSRELWRDKEYVVTVEHPVLCSGSTVQNTWLPGVTQLAVRIDGPRVCIVQVHQFMPELLAMVDCAIASVGSEPRTPGEIQGFVECRMEFHYEHWIAFQKAVREYYGAWGAAASHQFEPSVPSPFDTNDDNEDVRRDAPSGSGAAAGGPTDESSNGRRDGTCTYFEFVSALLPHGRRGGGGQGVCENTPAGRFR